jgi:hypothetical protein
LHECLFIYQFFIAVAPMGFPFAHGEQRLSETAGTGEGDVAPLLSAARRDATSAGGFVTGMRTIGKESMWHRIST